MNIAIFTETYIPDINGVVTHVKILAEGLQSLGHEVLIVTADANSRRNFIEKNVLHCPAVRAKKIYNYSLSSPVSLKRLRILKKFKPDIIHIHNEFGIGLSGAFIARFLKIPYVYTLHTMYDDYIHYIAKKPFVPIVTDVSHKYFKQLAKKATALTGPSVKVENYFKQCGLNKYVSVISNPVELDKFSPEKVDANLSKAFRNKFGFSDEDTVACFCGRLGKEKGIDTLFSFWQKTVSKSDNIKLIIFGDGPEKEELQNLAQNLGIDDMVFFTGKVPHDELPVFLNGCQMYITASLTEMHSISMLEAMASGLPVLYINDESNKNQIDDGVNGFIYSDAEEMYEKITRIKNMSAEEYKNFSNSVRQSVAQSGAEGLGKILIEIYDNSIKSFKK